MEMKNVLYIFIVLGCWVKFAFPEVGFIFDTAWFGVMWGTIIAFALGICAVLFMKTSKAQKEELAAAYAETVNSSRFCMLVLSAALACHIWTAFAAVVAIYGLLAALRYKTLGKK